MSTNKNAAIRYQALDLTSASATIATGISSMTLEMVQTKKIIIIGG